MKKIFTLIAGVMFVASANAVTPYKNLYVEASVYPTGSGYVYLDGKNDEDKKFIYEQSEDYGETAFIKYVGGENGGGGDAVGCNAGMGVYEIAVFVDPEVDYELVCYADKIKEDGIYGKSDVYPVIDGTGEGQRSWNFEWSGEGNWININCPDDICPVTGSSDGSVEGTDGRKREDCFKRTDFWNADPDTYVYVIMRKVGDELPKFVEDETAIHGLTIDNKSNGATYNLSGQQVGKDFKGVVIKDGKKIVNK
ncbi:MAG: hypothetical protein IJK49_03470 [Prevotella sp.]|nr:hypothetical protein [Prevotella sp.]